MQLTPHVNAAELERVTSVVTAGGLAVSGIAMTVLMRWRRKMNKQDTCTSRCDTSSTAPDSTRENSGSGRVLTGGELLFIWYALNKARDVLENDRTAEQEEYALLRVRDALEVMEVCFD